MSHSHVALVGLDHQPSEQSSSSSHRFGTQTADSNSAWVRALFDGSDCRGCGHLVGDHAWTEWPRGGDIYCGADRCGCYLRRDPLTGGSVRQRSEDLGV